MNSEEVLKCIICNGTDFSIRIDDINKPISEQYREYGDCCCLSCAMEKHDNALKENPNNFEKMVLKSVSGSEFIINEPKKKKAKF